MKKLTKISVLLIILFFAVGRVHAQSAPNYYEQIPEFKADYVINNDATIDVKESIRYYFDAPRHGIFRTVPLTKENQDGDKFLIKATNISVTDENNNPIQFQNNSTKKKLNLKIGDPNKTITGVHTYVIWYKLSGAVTYFSDHDEFYWNVNGFDWDVPIKSMVASVYFPNGSDFTDISCYTGAFNSNDSKCNIEEGTKTAKIETTTELLSGENLTISVSFPKNIVATVIAQKDSSSLIAKLVTILIFIVVLGLYLVLPIVILIKSAKRRKKYKDLEKREVAAWFDPPKTPGGRFLTAGEVGILYDRKGDIRDITASIIQLAQKGYLKIVEKSKKGLFRNTEYEFIKLKDYMSDENLLEHEKSILDFIFEGNEKISTKEIAKRTTNQTKIAKIYKEIAKQLTDEGIFDMDPYKTKNTGILISVAGAMFFNILLAIAGIIYGKSSSRTQKGAEAYAVVKSLENFVKSQDKQIEFQAKKQMFFEKLLPYATALGVEKIWLERFKDIDMQQSDWVESDSGTIAYAAVLSNFNNSFTNTMSISSTRSSSGFSSGGGGGGFSGGGGGGGGGGSW